MKRLFAVFLALCLCLAVLTACGKQQETEDLTFVIIPSVYSDTTLPDSSVDISYPQLQGEEYAQINDIIKHYAVDNVAEYYGNDYSDLTLDIDYRVTLCDGKIFSVIFEGTGNVYSAAHPNHLFYTLNIDMKTGEQIKLANRYTVDSAFVAAYRSSPCIQSDEALAEAITMYIDSYSDSELAEMLSQADTGEGGVYSYYTYRNVGISIPTIYAIGDHAEVEIKYTSIDNNKLS